MQNGKTTTVLGSPESSEVDVIEFLDDCSSSYRAAQILSDGQLREAVFGEAEPGCVTLYIRSDVRLEFNPLSLACVTFTYGDGSRIFLAPVQELEPPRLILKMPSEIATAEGRITYRVPNWKNSGRQVNVVTSDNQRWSRQGVHLNFSGILVEFPRNNVPELLIGSYLDVELSLDTHSAKLSGLVRHRQDERQFGVFFPETVSNVEVKPPASLRNIVKELERHWLEQRSEARSLEV